MSKPTTTPASSPSSLAENMGYAIGTLVAVLQELMPLRLWITLGMSFGFVLRVFTTDSILDVARWTAVYVALMGLLMGSSVFSKRR